MRSPVSVDGKRSPAVDFSKGHADNGLITMCVAGYRILTDATMIRTPSLHTCFLSSILL